MTCFSLMKQLVVFVWRQGRRRRWRFWCRNSSSNSIQVSKVKLQNQTSVSLSWWSHWNSQRWVWNVFNKFSLYQIVTEGRSQVIVIFPYKEKIDVWNKLPPKKYLHSQKIWCYKSTRIDKRALWHLLVFVLIIGLRSRLKELWCDVELPLKKSEGTTTRMGT